MDKKELILIASICTLLMVGTGVYLRQTNQTELTTEVSNLYCRVYGDEQSCKSSGYCSWNGYKCAIDCSVNNMQGSQKCNQYPFCYYSSTGMGGACNTLCQRIEDNISCNNTPGCTQDGSSSCLPKSGH